MFTKSKFLLLSVAFFSFVACSEKESDEDNGHVKSDKWISEILEYRPAPGQFINTDLGNMSAAQSIVGRDGGMVSLGGYGGFITFRFNHDVENRSGVDFVIKSDAFYGSSEPGIVMVSYDANGNDKADDIWYELAGVKYDTYEKNYTITWKKPFDLLKATDVEWYDSKEVEGVFNVELLSELHGQCFYPKFLVGNPSELSFTGTLIPNNAVWKNDRWVLEDIGKGYACTLSSDWNDVVGGDEDTKESNKFDLDNAVDNSGKKVNLDKITFVKVYTAIHVNCENLGETSTELCGAISLSRK